MGKEKKNFKVSDELNKWKSLFNTSWLIEWNQKDWTAKKENFTYKVQLTYEQGLKIPNEKDSIEYLQMVDAYAKIKIMMEDEMV